MVQDWKLLKHKEKEKIPAVNMRYTQFWLLFETVPLGLLATVLKVYGISFNIEVDNQN